MVYPFEVFRQDLEVAQNALVEEDFRSFTIISNRIMSNATFGTERKFAIIGFMLKETAMSLAQIKSNTKTAPYSTALALAKAYTKKLLKETDSTGFSEQAVWSSYTKFLEEMRTYEMQEFESKTYTKDHKFTKDVFAQLLSYLKANKGKLNNRRNQLLNGVLNEMVRVHRAHGGEESEIYSASIMFLLSWCDQYPKAVATDQEQYEIMIKDTILPFVGRATEVLVEPMNFEKVSQLAWELIVAWRHSFIDFMEPTATLTDPSQGGAKPILLPEETKKKLANAITKSLEDETKTKKT
jgi:hypothetical protein